MAQPKRKSPTPGAKPKGRQPRNIGYRRVSTKGWAEAVSRTFTYRPYADGYLYHGLCPRCRHATSMAILHNVIIRDAVAVETLLPEPIYIQRLTVHCECEAAHAKDKQGCGAYGNVLGIRFVP
jgi:hypothetical protein